MPSRSTVALPCGGHWETPVADREAADTLLAGPRCAGFHTTPVSAAQEPACQKRASCIARCDRPRLRLAELAKVKGVCRNVQASINRTSINRTSINRTSINRTSINRTSINRTSINRTSINRTSINRTAPIIQARSRSGGRHLRPSLARQACIICRRAEHIRGNPRFGRDQLLEPERRFDAHFDLLHERIAESANDAKHVPLVDCIQVLALDGRVVE